MNRSEPEGSFLAAEIFSGQGEMALLMRATDWAKTPLGPVEGWPNSLKTMVRVVLGSRFPMLVWWGPDLLHLYNDAYLPILRHKHPASLAAPAAEVWAEVWDVAGPMARSVQEGGPATWTEDLQLFIKSGTMDEETYFTFSYSPIPGDDGGPGGVLNTVQETTAKVQSERQILMLRDLAARAAEAKSEVEAYGIAAEVLSANELDLPFILLYRLSENADRVHLVGVSGWKEYEGSAKPVDALIHDQSDGTSWPFAEVIRTRREVVVQNLSARFGPLPVGRWNARPERAIILPLCRADQSIPYAFLVAGTSPHRLFDERYQRFFQATADQVANIIANARAYEAEKKRTEALVEIDRAKTVFFSNMSHEFRTPITLLLGPVEDLLTDPKLVSDPRHHERLSLIHRNALRLNKLVTGLLDFSRLEAKRMKATYVPTDLSRWMAESASAFQSAITQVGLRFVVDCPPVGGPAYLDRDMWEKVVLNLLSNALKFTFEGEIGVRVSEKSQQFMVTVWDTGTGIPKEEVPRLFERFYRVQGAQARSYEGTGIGLSLVQELVKLHGGLIQVESTVGKGTTFTITIPKGHAHLPTESIGSAMEFTRPGGSAYVEEALHWLPDDESFQAFINGGAELSRGERSARILLADDNADMRGYVARLLTPHYFVDAVEDGQAALEAIQRRPPDLVLTDVMMPRLDGFGLLKALRKESTTKTLPVIFLSARAGEEATVEGIEQGADDYLVKPFSAKELLARVRTHLELARMRQTWMRELEQVNKELESFSYSISHDLRAPLRAIAGFSAILLEDHARSLNQEGQRILNIITTSTEQMGRLIDDLLEFSRLGRQPLKNEAMAMKTMVEGVIGEWRQMHPDLNTAIFVGDLPSAYGDASLIRQVIRNLVSNACKYSKNNPAAKIEIGTMAQGLKNQQVTFFVSDNGAGFDMQYVHKLFGVFQRLHRQEDFEGTGIGLANVKRIIQRHGGEVRAEGEVGKGATFYFSLPTHKEENI